MEQQKLKVIDVFCGVGGLSHGLLLEGFNVVAGLDADESCEYAYVENNKAEFLHKSIENVKADDIKKYYEKDDLKVLVGCAPCQPFSSYNRKKGKKDSKWKLLNDFSNLICEIEPDIVSMENVTNLRSFQNGEVFNSFVSALKEKDYFVSNYDVYCPDYGIPQNRTRLVLFASKFGAIDIIEKTHSVEDYKTVRKTISNLERLEHGEVSEKDEMHKCSGLSELNLERIQASKPGGTWRDWDEELIAECHKRDSGKSYGSVYGRMEWDKISPTITTQYYGYGNGRFGHPEQNRALSHREAALIQTFPSNYRFFPPGEFPITHTIGRHIGNAVPVDLARVIAKSIISHLKEHEKQPQV